MEMLKKYFPLSFGEKKDIVALIINIVIYLVAGLIVGAACWVVGLIPIIGGIVAWLVGSLCELYVFIGIVLSVLDYLKVLK